MTDFTAINYLQNASRSVAEMKLAMEQNLAAAKEAIGGGPVQNLTVSGTSITPAASGSEVYNVSSGGPATINLTNIITTNVSDGSVVYVRMANPAQVIVVKHAAGGAGQILLTNSQDLSLAAQEQILVLVLISGTWTELGRWYGSSTAAAARTFYNAASLGANIFTGRQDLSRGANLTAASTLAIGTDGNYFSVFGTASIFAISTAPAGTVITLRFIDGPLLVQGAALQIGGANLQTAPGQTLDFVSDGGGAWRLKSAPGGVQVLTRDVSQIGIVGSAAETNLYGVVIPAGTMSPTGHVRVSMQGFVGVDQAGFPTGTGPVVKLLQFITYLNGIAFATSEIVTATWDGAGFGGLNPWAAVTYDVHIVAHGGGVISVYTVITCPITYTAMVAGQPITIGGGWPLGNPGFGSSGGFNPALAISVQINGALRNYVGGNDAFYKMHGMLVKE